MGLEVGDIYRAIQLMLAPVYVNDFVDAGRVKRVTMQADTGFRNGPESLAHFYTPSPTAVDARTGPSQMAPLSNLVDRSEARRGGKECGGTCRSQLSPSPYTKNQSEHMHDTSKAVPTDTKFY